MKPLLDEIDPQTLSISCMTPILKIAIPTPLRRTFDYLPHADNIVWEKGQRVRVPFGRRTVVGVVIAIESESTFPRDKLKTIEALIDDVPLLDAKLLSLYHFASEYYQHPIGDVILGTLPKKIRAGEHVSIDEKPLDLCIEKALPNFVLTNEQENAIDTLVHTKEFQPFLLAGVTGSGKTEVYLRVIAEVLKNKKQALVLVPEISLTPQTVSRFKARFSVPVLLLHSGLTDVKRFRTWLQAEKSTPCIVIGTRSAVFAPLRNCGVIIVDEEHDASFKQQGGFRYSARDVAVMRAKLWNIPIVLGSATPSIESIHNVNQKKYQQLILSERAGNAVMPAITLHNICGEKLKNGLSKRLIEKMHLHLKAGNQVLLFLNRRGYAPVLMCHACGFFATCAHCDAKMTVHNHPRRLSCHHCGDEVAMIRICPGCQKNELMLLGSGTERLEESIREVFSDKTICRIDRDSVKNFATLKTTLQKVHDKAVDILVGTQMLVKGHHFEHVTLVAALDVDNALFSSDFRAVERLGQSLLQVSGRAGRSEKPGEVFIQTHHPEHELMQVLFQSGYAAFASALLQERLQTVLPPFATMVVLRAESKNKKIVETFLHKAKLIMQSTNHVVSVVGPFPMMMEKKGGSYRMQLILQSSSRITMKQRIGVFLQATEREKKISGLKWIVDVDPIEVI